MDFSEVLRKSTAVREEYRKLEIKRGKIWGAREHTEGLVGDVGDLVKLIMAKENLREVDDLDSKIKHELVDCLYSIFVIADDLGINIEKEYIKKIDELKEKVRKINKEK